MRDDKSLKLEIRGLVTDLKERCSCKCLWEGQPGKQAEFLLQNLAKGQKMEAPSIAKSWG